MICNQDTRKPNWSEHVLTCQCINTVCYPRSRNHSMNILSRQKLHCACQCLFHKPLRLQNLYDILSRRFCVLSKSIAGLRTMNQGWIPSNLNLQELHHAASGCAHVRSTEDWGGVVDCFDESVRRWESCGGGLPDCVFCGGRRYGGAQLNKRRAWIGPEDPSPDA